MGYKTALERNFSRVRIFPCFRFRSCWNCFWDALYLVAIMKVDKRTKFISLKFRIPAFLFWRHSSAIPSLLTRAVLYPTGSENSDVSKSKGVGRKLGMDFFQLFYLRKPWCFDWVNKEKSFIYTLTSIDTRCPLNLPIHRTTIRTLF